MAGDYQFFHGEAWVEEFAPSQLSQLVDRRAVELIELGLSQELQTAVAVMQPTEDGASCEYVTAAHGLAHRAPFCRYLRSFPEGERLCHANDCRVYQRLQAQPGPDPEAYYPCHMHLVDLAAPVRVGGRLVAVLFSGQRRLRRWDGALQARLEDVGGLVPGLNVATLRRHAETVRPATSASLLRLRDQLADAAGQIQQFAEHRYNLWVAFQARERLVAEGTHELRAALQAALIEAEFLDMYGSEAGLAPPPEIAEALERICGEIYHLRDRTLSRLLASRARVSEAIPECDYKLDREHDLRRLLDDCVRAYRGIARSRGITVQLEVHSAAPLRFRFDWESMRLVVSNLLDNAVKYAYADTYVRVGLARRDEWAVIAVENMGTGISADELTRVFERFYRARTRDAQRLIWGSGLGLTVAREIVEAHGGEIWAESTPGGRPDESSQKLEGYKTTFFVKLPLTRKGDSHGGAAAQGPVRGG
jgi:signal transduction histidine kinase